MEAACHSFSFSCGMLWWPAKLLSLLLVLLLLLVLVLVFRGREVPVMELKGSCGRPRMASARRLSTSCRCRSLQGHTSTQAPESEHFVHSYAHACFSYTCIRACTRMYTYVSTQPVLAVRREWGLRRPGELAYQKFSCGASNVPCTPKVRLDPQVHLQPE